ncbi:MAG: hypothetical protein NTV78_02950 [Caldiserica bacterium]|nr:hypothetical protein [Caldisericota bacterium]
MMKEKISKYIDGEGNKEELEKLLKEDPESKEYFEQLLLMKSTLSEMNVQSPDVLNKVLEKDKKHKIVFRYRFVFASLFAVAIVSVLFLTFYNFKPQEKGITTPQLRSGTQNPSFEITAVKPEINISIGVRDDEILLSILERHGTITGSSVKGNGEFQDELQPEGNATQKVLYYKIVANEIPQLVKDIEKIKGATITLPEALPEDNTEVEIIINICEK